jgi:spore coat polysaccharide biosynthesis predicted glycosyltransferase SpsG
LDTNSEYIRKLKNEGLFVVNFEDLGAGSDDSDMVFNALYEKTNPPNNHRYGYEYECLNDNFYRYDPIEFKEKCETLFVSFGGVDINNMAGRIANLVPKILQNSDIKNIIFVIGPGYCHKEEITKKIDSLKNPNIKIYSNVKNMAKLMSSTDLAITSNGRTVYELTSLGIPLISISQNDRETLHLFSRYHRGISYLGIACTISDEILLDNILELANNVTLRKNRYDEQIIASKTIKKGIDKIISEIKSKYETWKNEKI